MTSDTIIKNGADQSMNQNRGELGDAPYEMGSSIENRLKLRCISWRKSYV